MLSVSIKYKGKKKQQYVFPVTLYFLKGGASYITHTHAHTLTHTTDKIVLKDTTCFLMWEW